MLVHPAVFKTDCDGYSPLGRFDSCAPPPFSSVFDKLAASIEEVKARDGIVIATVDNRAHSAQSQQSVKL